MTFLVRVRAPCRLHFGMFSFGHPDQPQFGGIGVMVGPPNVNVTITPADCFRVAGNMTFRVRQFVEMASSAWQLPGLPGCEVQVQSPRDHIGLGVGTQVGLAVAAGLRRFFQLSDLPPNELALSVGRGTRSGVGTHGFHHGGLLIDAGKSGGESLGRLAHRVAVPESWRFVLVSPGDQQGLTGDVEANAFARLPPVPKEVTPQLWRIAEEEMIPAAASSDCEAFGDAVYRFGRLAGECFAPVQGGPFASREIARLIQSIRSVGVPGVGQSSWGPTIFSVTANDSAAQQLADWLINSSHAAAASVSIARPCNQGAEIETTRVSLPRTS